MPICVFRYYIKFEAFFSVEHFIVKLFCFSLPPVKHNIFGLFAVGWAKKLIVYITLEFSTLLLQ